MKKICRYCGHSRTVQPYRDSSRILVTCPLKTLIKFQIRQMLRSAGTEKQIRRLALKHCPRGGIGRR